MKNGRVGKKERCSERKNNDKWSKYRIKIEMYSLFYFQ